MSALLVTGATGTLGRHVVRQLQSRNASIRAFVRKTDPELGRVQQFVGDIRTGSGLSEAVEGVDAIVHCATFFEPGNITDLAGARHLLNAASGAGSPHLVYISIIGIDQSEFSYFQSKLEIEGMIEQSGLPHTILRATQFHDFVFKMIKSFEDDQAGVMRVPPRLRFQTIASDEVAEKLVDIALNRSVGRAPDMAGPEVLSLEAMVDTFKDVFRKPHVIEPDARDTTSYDAFRSSATLAPDRAVGRMTWDTFLQRQVQPDRERTARPEAHG